MFRQRIRLIFNESKYTKWYFNIIKKAQSEKRKRVRKNDPFYVYYEEHHIIPRSLKGTDDIQNLVLLTAKEHYIVHLLLMYMCISKSDTVKMCHAFMMMNNYKHAKSRYNANLYEYHKLKYSKTKSRVASSSRWYHNLEIKEEKFTQEKLKSPWKKGRLPGVVNMESRRDYTGINNPAYGIKRLDLIEKNKLPKAWITKNGKDKQILIENLDQFLKEGWIRGRSNRNWSKY